MIISLCLRVELIQYRFLCVDMFMFVDVFICVDTFSASAFPELEIMFICVYMLIYDDAFSDI